MELILNRKFKKTNYTIGSLSIGGEWLCNTLEPAVGSATEAVTAGSKKAIAEGTYKVRMAWSPKFQERLPMLEDVPGRSSILIHAGNTPRDTTGCILVGLNTHVGKVLQSQKTLEKLLGKIREEFNKGEKVTITINN